MELKRNIENKKLYITNKNEILLETDRLGAEFIISLHIKNHITITKEVDECLYFNLKCLIENNYFL